MSKIPSDPGTIEIRSGDVVPFAEPLWRIYASGGAHPVGWNTMREFGPLAGMRFDPHPPGPPAAHPDAAVYYAAVRPVTAFAEIFSMSRIIDRGRDQRILCSWVPTRPLRLLDITTDTVARLFGAASIQMVDDVVLPQRYARALLVQHGGDIDGIRSTSAVDNGHVVTLFRRAADAFPSSPRTNALLTAPSAQFDVLRAALTLGWGVI